MKSPWPGAANRQICPGECRPVTRVHTAVASRPYSAWRRRAVPERMNRWKTWTIRPIFTLIDPKRRLLGAARNNCSLVKRHRLSCATKTVLQRIQAIVATKLANQIGCRAASCQHFKWATWVAPRVDRWCCTFQTRQLSSGRTCRSCGPACRRARPGRRHQLKCRVMRDKIESGQGTALLPGNRTCKSSTLGFIVMVSIEDVSFTLHCCQV